MCFSGLDDSYFARRILMKLESRGGNRDHIYNVVDVTPDTVCVFHFHLTRFVRTRLADNITFRCPDGPVIHYLLHILQENKQLVSSYLVFIQSDTSIGIIARGIYLQREYFLWYSLVSVVTTCPYLDIRLLCCFISMRRRLMWRVCLEPSGTVDRKFLSLIYHLCRPPESSC